MGTQLGREMAPCDRTTEDLAGDHTHPESRKLQGAARKVTDHCRIENAEISSP